MPQNPTRQVHALLAGFVQDLPLEKDTAVKLKKLNDISFWETPSVIFGRVKNPRRAEITQNMRIGLHSRIVALASIHTGSELPVTALPDY